MQNLLEDPYSNHLFATHGPWLNNAFARRSLNARDMASLLHSKLSEVFSTDDSAAERLGQIEARASKAFREFLEVSPNSRTSAESFIRQSVHVKLDPDTRRWVIQEFTPLVLIDIIMFFVHPSPTPAISLPRGTALPQTQDRILLHLHALSNWHALLTKSLGRYQKWKSNRTDKQASRAKPAPKDAYIDRMKSKTRNFGSRALAAIQQVVFAIGFYLSGRTEWTYEEACEYIKIDAKRQKISLSTADVGKIIGTELNLYDQVSALWWAMAHSPLAIFADDVDYKSEHLNQPVHMIQIWKLAGNTERLDPTNPILPLEALAWNLFCEGAVGRRTPEAIYERFFEDPLVAATILSAPNPATLDYLAPTALDVEHHRKQILQIAPDAAAELGAEVDMDVDVDILVAPVPVPAPSRESTPPAKKRKAGPDKVEPVVSVEPVTSRLRSKEKKKLPIPIPNPTPIASTSGAAPRKKPAANSTAASKTPAQTYVAPTKRSRDIPATPPPETSDLVAIYDSSSPLAYVQPEHEVIAAALEAHKALQDQSRPPFDRVKLTEILDQQPTDPNGLPLHCSRSSYDLNPTLRPGPDQSVLANASHELWLSMSPKDQQELQSNRCVLIHESQPEPPVEFNEETLSRFRDLDTKIELQDCGLRTENNEDVIRIGTLRDLLDVNPKRGRPVINALQNPQPYQQVVLPPGHYNLATHEVACSHTSSIPELPPPFISWSDLRWIIIGTMHSMSSGHQDVLSTVIELICGWKLWMLASRLALPAGQYQGDFQSRFGFKDFDGTKSNKEFLRYECLLLGPGKYLIQSADSIHSVISLTDCIARGHHFHCIMSISRGISCSLNNVFTSRSTTNADHVHARALFIRIFILQGVFILKGSKHLHVLDITHKSQAFDLLYLMTIMVLYTAFDTTAYININEEKLLPMHIDRYRELMYAWGLVVDVVHHIDAKLRVTITDPNFPTFKTMFEDWKYALHEPKFTIQNLKEQLSRALSKFELFSQERNGVAFPPTTASDSLLRRFSSGIASAKSNSYSHFLPWNRETFPCSISNDAPVTSQPPPEQPDVDMPAPEQSVPSSQESFPSIPSFPLPSDPEDDDV
ncbi:hypothetical protein C8R43DRAFT_942538 [Mycena crocata]|nr:hypothetical protein C8R43DRAFT_942538 [Mycena crocata]